MLLGLEESVKVPETALNVVVGRHLGETTTIIHTSYSNTAHVEGNIAQVERNTANLNDRLAQTTYDVDISLHAEFSQPLLHFNEKLQTNQDITISRVHGETMYPWPSVTTAHQNAGP